MMKSLCNGGVFLFLVGAFASSAMGDFKTPILIQHAKIVPTPGQLIEDGSILIKDGRIVAVGKDVLPTPDAKIIDATGLIAYPGFIDAGTHLGMSKGEQSDDELPRLEDENPDVRQGPQSATVQAYRRLMHPRWRVAEMFDPTSGGGGGEAPRGRGMGGGGRGERGGPTEPSAPEEKDARAEYRSVGYTTALVSPKPAIFSGLSAVVSLGDAPVRRSILLSDFAQHAAFVTGIERGDFGAAFERPRYPTTTMGAMAAFRQIMQDAQWQQNLVAWQKTDPKTRHIAFDPDLEALREIADYSVGMISHSAKPVVFIANSENEIHRALDMAAEFNLKPIIAGAREAWKVIPRLKKENVPLIVSLKWPEDPEEKSKGRNVETSKESAASQPDKKESSRRKKLFDDEWESQAWEPTRLFDEKKRLWAEQVDNAKRLQEAGVPFALGSFEQKSPSDHIKNLHQAIDRGLPEDAALAALTTNAARILGPLFDGAGEIAAGRRANLTLLDKPLKDKEAKVVQVFVEGKQFEIDEDGKDSKGLKSRKVETSKSRNEDKKGDEGREEKRRERHAESQPTSAPSSQPVKRPEFACEIEADRKPDMQTGGNFLIKNATLLTLANGDMPETDLLIRNGKIAEIGKNLSTPEGIKTLDLHGYFVSPGIVDPHSHICSDGGLNEFSLSVTCEVRVRDVVDHTDESAHRALAGGVTCIHTMHGSANTIGGQNATLRLKYGRPAAEWLFKEAPRTVKFALGENVKQSNSDRRSRGTRFPNSRAGVEAVLRRSFDAARQYKADLEQFKKERAAGRDPMPVRPDLRLETLAAIHDGAIWVHTHCYRADEILRLLTVAEEYGVRIAVLQHVLEAYRIIPEIRRHGCGASTFSDWWAYKIEAFDAVPFNAARVEQGGVVTTVNSDSGEVMRHLNLEAAKSMHFGGLSANDALRLCTLNGAIQLGVDKYVGSIEVGKFADLAVWDAHPLDTFSKCVLTLIDGEVYFKHHDLNLQQAAPARPARVFAKPEAIKALVPLPGEDFWLVGGTVHPVSGPDIENGAVHIVQDKIAYVGPQPDAARQKGGTRMDTTGLHVYPGLVNVGTMLGLEEIGSVQGTIDTSEIADFQPDLQAAWAYNPFSALIEVARCEGVTSALIFQAGGNVSARAGLVHLDGWSMPEALIASPVALRMELPSLPTEFPDEMQEDRKMEAKKNHRKRVDEIVEFFDRAAHYAKVVRAAKDNPELKPELKPEFDRKLDAMIPYVTGEAPVLIAANSYKQIKEALEFAKRYNLRPIIHGGREAWKLADELAQAKIDVIFSRTTSYPAGKFEPWDSVYACPAALAKAGVRFCISVNDPSLVKQIGVEAGLAVAHGLSEDAALRAITLDAAKIVSAEDRIGTLEMGKTADVIVSTDSPLQASAAVVAEFVAGRPIELSSKHTRTDEKFRARPAPKLPAEPQLRGPPPMRPKPSAR